MQTLESIAKGNFNLEYTIKTFKHETNLRFHIKIGERFYEYAMKKLGELCHAFDQLSGSERKESLIEFLERFSRCDGIPPLKNMILNNLLTLSHPLNLILNKNSIQN